ncbi:Mitochondrial uncoupling protein 4C [Gryllus bimaculatus]|nr:Mitochondrial uncoupling protein 4C [Gryllus bimaculatus]
MGSVSEVSYLTSLIKLFSKAGGVAGIAVDTTLFPLDTTRTRLQSPQGFLKAGGFRGLYNGIGPAFLGSAPTVKVPTEVLKQRQQVGLYSRLFEACSIIYRTEGLTGFYRGLGSTIVREIPFSVIQFPLWEIFKQKVSSSKGEAITVKEKALCGAIAGGIAAGLTTPIDVMKTRIMLTQRSTYQQKLHNVLMDIYMTKGIKGLFAGIIPRVLWITLGGGVFFGSYELFVDLCNTAFKKT